MKKIYMKRKMIILIGCIILILFFQYGMDVRLVNSMRVSSNDGNAEHITIIANKIFIIDKKNFVEYLIQRRIDNSYKEIKYIDEFPTELEIDVYTNFFMWKIKQKKFTILSHFEDSKQYTFDIK